jgi:hypothetical protein
MYFVINDGNFYVFKDEDGKHVADDKHKWTINAEELRISPTGSHIVVAKNSDYFVAKLSTPRS